MHPIIDELAKDYIVYTVRLEDCPDAAADLHVTSLPLMVVFENRKELARYVGITSKANLTKRLKTRKSQTANYEFQ